MILSLTFSSPLFAAAPPGTRCLTIVVPSSPCSEAPMPSSSNRIMMLKFS